MCFYWLCQIRRIRRSLDTESAAAFVRALIASRVHYCNTVLAGAPRTITDSFQRLLDAAAGMVATCPNCFTQSCIDWTFDNMSSINSKSQFTGLCR